MSGKVLLEKIRDWRWTLKRRKALDKKGKGHEQTQVTLMSRKRKKLCHKRKDWTRPEQPWKLKFLQEWELQKDF